VGRDTVLLKRDPVPEVRHATHVGVGACGAAKEFVDVKRVAHGNVKMLAHRL
jgi:hypothetical protein